ncbi:MAG: hypothetical protein KAI24_03820 [Planctomycetes bacterium]|nr:hypothetical protein [Planctomycetota bacterium]
MRYLPLIAGALLFAAPAKADKFWLSDPKAEAKAAAGSSPNVIEGVLLAESDEGYHVRVEGGEILLPKDSVFKVEKDDLTLDAIVKAEDKQQQAGEQANEERRLAQQVRRAARDVRIAEASAKKRVRAVEAAASRRATEPQGFDPVLGVATGRDSTYEMMRDAQVAWSLTKDRRYLKLLRQLRRLR